MAVIKYILFAIQQWWLNLVVTESISITIWCGWANLTGLTSSIAISWKPLFYFIFPFPPLSFFSLFFGFLSLCFACFLAFFVLIPIFFLFSSYFFAFYSFFFHPPFCFFNSFWVTTPTFLFLFPFSFNFTLCFVFPFFFYSHPFIFPLFSSCPFFYPFA